MKSDFRYLYVALAGIFAFYCLVMPHSVTLEDSGELLMVASSFGIAHPPGYPLLGMIGGLFGILPTGNLALNIHFMSAIFGVLSLWVAFLVASHVTKDRSSALFGVILAGLAPTVVWFFTVAEVYSQFTFLFLICLHLVLKGERTEWLAFLIGLGLCAHWPLFVLAGPAVVMARPRLITKVRTRHIGFFLLGLSPFAFLLLRSLWGTPYMTTGAADSWTSMYELLSRKLYENVEKADASFNDELLYFSHTLSVIWRNLWWIGTSLATVGIGSLVRQRRLAECGALLWLMFGSNLAVRIFFRVEYDMLFGEQLEQFHVLPILAFGIATAAGVVTLRQWLPRRNVGWMVILTALAATLCVRNFDEYESQAQKSFAPEIAKLYLSLAPINGIYLAYGDADVGPFTYINRIEAFRPDVTIYSQSGFLVRPLSVTYSPGYEDRLAQFLRTQLAQGKSLVFSRIYPRLTAALTGLETRDYGILSEVSLPGQFSGLPPHALTTAIAFANRYTSGELRTERWKYHQEVVLGPLCRFLLMNNVDHPILQTTVYCRYYTLRDKPPADPALAEQRTRDLWRDAKYFPKDEKETIEKVVRRHLTLIK